MPTTSTTSVATTSTTMATTTSTLTKMEPPASTRQKAPRRKHICPDVDSLYDLLHQHSGTSLFVLPICWTDMQARLLGCKFSQLQAQRTPIPSASTSPRRSPRMPPTVARLCSDLNALISMDGSHTLIAKNRAMRNIMSTLYPGYFTKASTAADLEMRFGGRLYPRAVRCQVLWKGAESMSFDSAATFVSGSSTSTLRASMNSSNPVDPPVVAYVSRSHLDYIRRNCFRVVNGPNKSHNAPVFRLQTLRSKALIPSNQDEDSYLVATIIAIAQQAVYSDRSRFATISPRDVTVRLITVAEDEAELLVYTAVVPAAFLMMFHEPERAPRNHAGVKIDYQQVPVWPVLGLKERLGQALGREVVGDFDENNIETYADELTPVRELVSPKRRREVLSEVLNASFSEDREPVFDEGSLGKRRCLEEGRVGVVQ